MPGEAPARDPSGAAFKPLDVALFALTVLFWGCGWYALRLQLGVVPPEVSVAYRFAIAALVFFVWAAIKGDRLVFPLRDHLRFAAIGATVFSFNFLSYYYAGYYLLSGMLSVLFSLTAVLNVLLAAMLARRAPERRVLLGAVVGVAGVACLFAPSLAGTVVDAGTLKGLAFATWGTVTFVIGSQFSAAHQRTGVPIIASTAWGMAYGTAFLVIFALATGKPFLVEWNARYLVSLAFLAIGASVITFASYFTLVGRIGAARTGYSAVMFPLVALAISTALEHYQWTWIAVLGVAAILAGNVMVLIRPRSASA